MAPAPCFRQRSAKGISLVMAVASELQLPVYLLQLSSDEMDDEALMKLMGWGMNRVPSILLLEDIDGRVQEWRRSA